MPAPVEIGIIGDFDHELMSHRATNEAIQHAADALSITARVEWLPTKPMESQPETTLDRFDGLWSAPGGPYRSIRGALAGIRYAREHDRRFLGTCGGFQHVVIEYARNVMGFEDAQHAEYEPDASTLFVTPLSCSLLGQVLQIRLSSDSKSFAIYGRREIEEEYRCNFGLNPKYQPKVHGAGLRVVGVDDQGEARVLEIPKNRFFIATLFVPQLRSSKDAPHPLVYSYLEIAANFRDSR